MKGFVPTPDHLVDAMVEKLFASRWPRATDRLLDPGCGTGAFIHGVIRWCQRSGSPIPTIVGIDSDRELAATARRSFRGVDQVRIVAGEFLRSWSEQFDYIGRTTVLDIRRLGAASTCTCSSLNRRSTFSGRMVGWCS
jgi:protein-L-isoaspartate O-methyltransferase